MQIDSLPKWLLNKIGTRISAQFYDFGIQLQVPENTLQIIMQRCAHEKHERSFYQVVCEWIRQVPTPVTWGILIEALEAIGEKKLADNIKASAHAKEYFS